MSSSASQKKDNNVTVGVRVRPRNQKELDAEMPVFFTTTADSVQELDENGVAVKHWSYDHVFGPECTNLDVFQTMGSKLVDAAIEGYNTVMFMYGQTSSGKTFTLFGGNNVAGVVQHAMEHVHLRVKNSTDTEYVIKLTYAELYNEEIKDLLSPTPNENLKIIEDPNMGPLIQNITEASFTSAADVKILLEEGENRRHFGVTNMNAHSSRSHVIVRLNIESRKVTHKVINALRPNWGKDRPHCVSTLNLVDLAGSERANKAGTSGQSLKEGSFINKSLLTLGTVIANLSEGKLQHIPYRNSKLTRLLATALGGNAKTSVITCISPASGNVAESLNTLRFASRAKRIVNHVQKNELMDMRSLTNKLTVQLQEIEHLRSQLELSRQMGFCPDDTEPGDTLRDKAIAASKTMRSLKFFVKEGARIMNGLRAAGMSHLAKKAKQEIKEIINGQRDPASMVEEYSTLIETYLFKDRRLMEKVHNVAMCNESEAIVNVQDGVAVDAGLGDFDSDDEDDDAFAVGGEEMREAFETTSMQGEELRARACDRISQLERELIESAGREKALRKSLDDSQQTIVENHESSLILKNNERILRKQLDELKHQRKHDQQMHAEQLKELNARMADVQLKLDNSLEKLTQKNLELNAKDNENEGLRNQIEQLVKDLNATIASKKAFEEESSRARSEMRIQMDKLRSNMHEMLVQGGVEAKVIESQNVALHKELDDLREDKDRISKEKEHLEQDRQQLQAILATARDSEKSKQDEIAALRNENMDQAQKVRDLRLEIMKLTTNLSFIEELNKNLQIQMKAEVKAREDLIDEKDKEMVAVKEKARAKVQDMQVEIDIRDAEIESLQDQINQKAAFATKIEQSIGMEVARLEKKLAAQVKLCEELTVENSNGILQAQLTSQKHHEEVKALKHKINEQQAAMDEITVYLEQQERALQAEFQYQENNDDRRSSTLSSASSGFGADYVLAPLSRSASMMTTTVRPSLGLMTTEDDASLNYKHLRFSTDMLTTDSAAVLDRKSARFSPLSMDPSHFQQEEVNTPVPGSNSPWRSNWTSPSEGEIDFDQDELFSTDRSCYDQIVYGLSLATALMECNIQQEKELRRFLRKGEQALEDKLSSQQFEFEKLQETEMHLREVHNHLQESLSFNQTTHATLRARYEELESKFELQRKEYFKTHQQEQVALARSHALESTVREQQVLLDKLRQDVIRLEGDARDERLKHLATQGHLAETEERFSLLQTRCDLIKAEKDLLARERENLMRKYNAMISNRSRADSFRSDRDCVRENEEMELISELDSFSPQEKANSHLDGLDNNRPHSPASNNNDSNISAILDKYRRQRTPSLPPSPPHPSLAFSSTLGGRISLSSDMNTLRTYAINTGDSAQDRDRLSSSVGTLTPRASLTPRLSSSTRY